MRRSVLGLVLVVGAGLALAGCQVPQGSGSSNPPSLPAPSVITEHWRMPNLVGTGLQKAQDDIQKLTHNGIFFTSSHDVTGSGRRQLIDSDWQVCTQNVHPGATIKVTTKIDFGVVKTSEHCP